MTIKESKLLFEATNMDCAPNINIFRELQVVLDTGYFSGQISPEEDWQQVNISLFKEINDFIIIITTRDTSTSNHNIALILFSDMLRNGKVSQGGASSNNFSK